VGSLAIVPEHAVGSELLWGDLEVKSGKTQGAQALDDTGATAVIGRQ